jgi:hypothetical protein
MQMEHCRYSVEELLDLRKNKMLAVNPEYQRGEVWDAAQKKRLTDSIFRRYPIPLIYLHHIKTEVAGMKREDLEIIDGQQRLNALYEFREGAFRLFDPVKDDREARFPTFLKAVPCPWGGRSFEGLSESLRAQFLATELAVVKIETENANEARDLFIRLQAGLPLNPQEKRDAWPGGFTDFILRLGGKPGIARYPGHDFFRKLVGGKGIRGEIRQLAAQIAMLFFAKRETGGERLTDINARAIDDFYYRHLDFDGASEGASRLIGVLDRLTQILGEGKGRPLKGHETIHLVLLVDSLLDEYTRSWEARFAQAFDTFMASLARDKKSRNDLVPGEFWLRYGAGTRVNSDREATIRLRHEFFCSKMFEFMAPLQLKDPQRLYGPLERDIIYFRDKKLCGVCRTSVAWIDVEIHHVVEHAKGGPTNLENGRLVHKQCHPRGRAAEAFARQSN